MARDERTYIRVHDGMPDHPKIDGLSDRAFRLLVETWCWCSRHLTDGRVPTTTWVKRGTPKARAELMAAGLADSRDGYVQMHDYLEHQRSAEEVAEIREARSAAGVLANHERWHKGKPKTGCPHCATDPCTDPPTDPKSDAKTDPNGLRKSSTETETETDNSIPTGSSSSAAPRADARRLCDHLADRIEANGSRRPRITRRWLTAARLMLDVDGRSEEHVHRAIDWCQSDEFWRANILSMPKLRERYDQLRLAAEQRKRPANGHTTSPTDARIAALLAGGQPHLTALPGGA
jgi:hypothetical protein